HFRRASAARASGRAAIVSIRRSSGPTRATGAATTQNLLLKSSSGGVSVVCPHILLDEYLPGITDILYDYAYSRHHLPRNSPRRDFRVGTTCYPPAPGYGGLR